MTNSINKTNTGLPEWYTPDYIVNAARNTMGSIDCDPASTATAQNHIKAKVYYTKTTNGIDKDWKGTVWLNPPYLTGNNKNPGINAFSAKLIEELNSGNAKQAIFLAQAKTDTQWFQSLKAKADAVIFTKKRIHFIDSTGKKGGSPGYGSVFFYFGPNKIQFINQFEDFCYTL